MFAEKRSTKFWVCQLERNGGADQNIMDQSGAWLVLPAPLGFHPASTEVTTAIVRQSPNTAPEVWAGPIGNWTQLTHVNADVKPAWGRDEECALDA